MSDFWQCVTIGVGALVVYGLLGVFVGRACALGNAEPRRAVNDWAKWYGPN